MSPSPVLPFGPAALALGAAAGELRLDAAVAKHTGYIERDGRDDDTGDSQAELDHRAIAVSVDSGADNGILAKEHATPAETETRDRVLLGLVHLPHVPIPSSLACVNSIIANHNTINIVRQASTYPSQRGGHPPGCPRLGICPALTIARYIRLGI